MPFVQDQTFINFIDSLSELELNQFLKTEPIQPKRKKYIPFQNNPHHRKEKPIKIKVLPEHRDYIKYAQKEFQESKRPGVDLKTYKIWNQDSIFDLS
jgi:hypothetical protein